MGGVMNRKPYGRVRLHREPVSGGSGKIRRILLLLVIAVGLVVSLFSLLRKRDVVFHINEMINHREFKKAQKLAERFHRKQPENVRILRLMGLNYFMQGMKSDHWQVIKLDKDSKGYTVDRLKQQDAEGWKLYKKAVEALKKAILLDKAGLVTSRDYMIIGFSYSRWGDSHFKKALKYLTMAEKLDRKDHILRDSELPAFSLESLYRQRGYILYKTGKYKKAAENFSRANGIDRRVLNYLYMAHCYRAIGKTALAVRYYTRVADYSKEPLVRGSCLNMLGGLYLKAGKMKLANRAFRKSISINSNAASAWFGLSQVAEACGDRTGAKKFWDRTLKADPNYGPAILKMRNSRRQKR